MAVPETQATQRLPQPQPNPNGHTPPRVLRLHPLENERCRSYAFSTLLGLAGCTGTLVSGVALVISAMQNMPIAVLLSTIGLILSLAVFTVSTAGQWHIENLELFSN